MDVKKSKCGKSIYPISTINSKSQYYYSRCGTIFGPSLKALKPRMGGYKKRYCRFSCRIDGKSKDFYVHRVILSEEKGLPLLGMEAAHNDGNPENNHIDNLRWATPKENSLDKIKHGTSGVGEKNAGSKLFDHEAVYIVKNYKIKSNNELATKFNVSGSLISMIVTGKIRHKKELNKLYSENSLIAQQRIIDARGN